MNYLLAGAESLSKDQKIAEIRREILKTEEASHFDYEVLHGAKLDPADLKKSLISLPVLSKKRVVLIRAVEKLSQQNKELVLEAVQEQAEYLVLILDAQASEINDSFLGKLAGKVKVFQFGLEVKRNVFDMTRSMSSRNSVETMEILSELLADGDHPLQMMGALVWFWGKNRPRMSQRNFKEGLKVLQDADLNIKRSRLKPEHALEVAVTKLSSLLTSPSK